jgi:hypothetical protein
LILGRVQAQLCLVDAQLRRGGIQCGQELTLVDVLADLHVNVRERPAGLEVGLDLGAGFDVAAARDG